MGSRVHEPRSRPELENWLVDPPAPARPPVVLLIRGDTHNVRDFVPKALIAAKRFPHREAVWVRDPSLFTSKETTDFFKDDDSIIAAALSTRHVPKGWVTAAQADEAAAELAFLEAEK